MHGNVNWGAEQLKGVSLKLECRLVFSTDSCNGTSFNSVDH